MRKSSTSAHKALTCAAWRRLGRGSLATQLPTPVSGNGVQPSHKLADYLPASLVGAFNEAGDMHDLYPWQVGSSLLLQRAHPYSPDQMVVYNDVQLQAMRSRCMSALHSCHMLQ